MLAANSKKLPRVTVPIPNRSGITEAQTRSDPRELGFLIFGAGFEFSGVFFPGAPGGGKGGADNISSPPPHAECGVEMIMLQ